MHISLLWASWWSNVFICATGTCFVLSQQYLGGATKKLISTKNSTLQKRLSDLVVQEMKTPAPRKNTPPTLAFSNPSRCRSLKRQKKTMYNERILLVAGLKILSPLYWLHFCLQSKWMCLDSIWAVVAWHFIWPSLYNFHFEKWRKRWVASPLFANFSPNSQLFFSFQEATFPIADIFQAKPGTPSEWSLMAM